MANPALEDAWAAAHDALPHGWTIGRPEYVSGQGEDQAAALADLAAELMA